ncbi:MAG TPA: acetyl-CoA carboxylase biotin carboxyl carrier protein, partial [Candidatus Kapabacteria bacterium]|nr:acetyl-CoA carboxylase biotin carboxyl carrier protein [Candidatus Kapabacteria bacterium]
MEIEYLKQLMQLFDQSSATELSIEEEGTKVHISRQPAQQTVHMVAAPAAPVHAPQPVQQQQQPPIAHTPNAEVIPPAPAANLHIIHSPIVGTFYRASAPEAPPFVKVGDKVNVGSPLCIVEAMKLMNEIESDVAGTVVRCLV